MGFLKFLSKKKEQAPSLAAGEELDIPPPPPLTSSSIDTELPTFPSGFQGKEPLGPMPQDELPPLEMDGFGPEKEEKWTAREFPAYPAPRQEKAVAVKPDKDAPEFPTIPSRFEEKSAHEPDERPAGPSVKFVNGQVFVNAYTYREMIEGLNRVRSHNSIFSSLKRIRESEDRDYRKLEAVLEDMHKRLVSVDESLFEQEGR